MRALEGMRVIDLSHVIAGPTCGHYLAQQGAEVIKVEEPVHGDILRVNRRAQVDAGISVGFAALNADKRSIAIDLKDPARIAALRALAATADVFIENFRPGVVRRLGLDYDAIRAVKPDIVYVSISGFGQEGEWSPRGAYDHVVQALTGMMSLQGDEGSDPVKVGFPVIDAAAGMVAAQGVLAALLRRMRTGEGAYLDVSMVQAAMQLMLSPAVLAGFEGRDRPRPGNRGFSGSPGAATFRCAEGWIATAANTAAQFGVLCRELGVPELLEDASLIDPRSLAAGGGFVVARDEAALHARLAAAFARHGADALERRLAAAGVPAARVRGLAEFVGEYAGGATVSAPVGSVAYPGGSVLDLGPGWKADGRAPAQRARAPFLGEHTDDLLGSGSGGAQGA
jgi:crotonobetainyl-CoA:carnitine CoA-transferase CaiB-like acyl-CoA transferase